MVNPLDVTRPYAKHLNVSALAEEVWQSRPVGEVVIDGLILTSATAYAPTLLAGHEDPVRIVRWRGQRYVHDGNSAVLRAILLGQTTIRGIVMDLTAP